LGGARGADAPAEMTDEGVGRRLAAWPAPFAQETALGRIADLREGSDARAIQFPS
jgi:hypothetical protein